MILKELKKEWGNQNVVESKLIFMMNVDSSGEKSFFTKVRFNDLLVFQSDYRYAEEHITNKIHLC